jgi:hypothetical protein
MEIHQTNLVGREEAIPAVMGCLGAYRIRVIFLDNVNG